VLTILALVVEIGEGFGWWVEHAVLVRLPAQAASGKSGVALPELKRISNLLSQA